MDVFKVPVFRDSARFVFRATRSSPAPIALASSALTIPCAPSIATCALLAAMSCRHSALSNGIEAFISRMIAAGPASNRPPHIVLEPPVQSSRLLKTAVLGLAVVVAGCDRQSAAPAQPADSASAAAEAGALDRSHKGGELPELVFADPAGHPVLINLWATWCAPCVAELPTLDALAVKHDGQLKVLTVSQDSETSGKVSSFFDQRGIKRLEAWLDPENALTDFYRVSSLPTTILYDARGREVWRFAGPRDWGDADSAKLLAEGL
jgi:thiol-disulfide isomerase/thioredoxin